MAGTITGGKKAALKNLAKNPNFYRDIGKVGGSRSSNGGFAAKTPCRCPIIRGSHTKPMCAGKRGGMINRRKPNMETNNGI